MLQGAFSGVALLLLTTGWLGVASAATIVTVCELSQHLERYTGTLVAVRAILVDNSLDVSYLGDRSCPHDGVDLRWTSDPQKLSRLAPLVEIFRHNDSMTPPRKQVTATFIGVVQIALADAWPKAILVLEVVEDLTVADVPGSDRSN